MSALSSDGHFFRLVLVAKNATYQCFTADTLDTPREISFRKNQLKDLQKFTKIIFLILFSTLASLHL